MFMGLTIDLTHIALGLGHRVTQFTILPPNAYIRSKAITDKTYWPQN
jgi:hypothetical protein